MENEPAMQPPQPAAHKSHTWVWIMLLFVVMIAGAGLAGWQYMEAQKARSDSKTKQDIVASLQTETADLKAEVANLKTSPNAVAKKDTDLILAATDAYVRAPVAAASEKFTYAVKDNTGKFAKVSVAVAEGTGYEVTLKKVDDNWTVLFAGQDLPLKDVGEKYGLPDNYYQK